MRRPMTPASVNQPHAVSSKSWTMPLLQTPLSHDAEEIDRRTGHQEEYETCTQRPAPSLGVEAAALPALKYSNMVPRPVARKRKSAQTRSQSVNPSRKRRRGGGTFSRKMVISSDTPAALPHTRVRKIMEVSQVSPKLNQLHFSDYASDVSKGRAKEAVSLRQPLCCDDLTTGLDITGDASPSEQLPSDNFLQISNQGVDWYTGILEPSTSDSEHIAIIESEEKELNGLAESESQVEIFPHLRRKLQQLVFIRLSLPKEEAGCQTFLHRTKAFAEVMKRLDRLSETWTNGTTADDKAQRSPLSSSPDLGVSVRSNSHRRFEQLGEISCNHPVGEQPRQSELVRVIDGELPVDMNAKIRSDALDRKYWYSKSSIDHLGSSQLSCSQDWSQQERGVFSGELLRARASRLPSHTEVSHLINVKLPFSPKTCNHLHSWQQDRTSISSPPTPSKISPARTCINETCLPSSPFDSAVIRNDTSQKNLVAICAITTANDEDRNSTTIGQQAKKKFLDPWKNFQDHHSPLTAAGFKNCLESGDDQFTPLVSGKPEHELYNCCWDKMSASIDCQDIAFHGSDDWETIDEAEGSAFPPLQGLDFCPLEYGGEEDEAPKTFHRGSSAPPAAFSRSFLNGPDGPLT